MVHNGIEYGLMQAYAEGFEVMQKSEFDLDLHEIAGIWRYGSVVRSWLLELLHSAFEKEGGELEAIRGYVEDSGEGRWTIAEAIAEDVPVPVISAALFARFASRQDESFAAKVNAALRNQFGGHAVQAVEQAKAASQDPARLMAATDEQNPLAEGLQLRRRPDSCILVIFGASGDLTAKKLMPALYALAVRGLLPEHFGIVGAARSEESDDQFRERMKQAVKDHARDPFEDEAWEKLAGGMRYTTLDFADDKGEDDLRDVLTKLDEERGTQGNRVYYFAVPPAAIGTLIEEIAERRGAEGWIRLIIEKPFGHDLASARELNAQIQQHFAEEEVFRIDHYLGKETVQNMLALRFANGIFEPIWNRQFIDHVQITVAESIGIEGRAGYYEAAGAIRDIFQNHLLQLLAITAMEPPIDFTADSVRNEKVKVLKSLHTPGPKHLVRGQYGPGFVEGQEVRALSRGGGRLPELDDRDVRRGEAVRRQLALGRHAVLRAHGQAPRPARDDDRDPVQARAASAVRGRRLGRAAAERAADPRAAERRRVARDRREGAGAGDEDPDRAHGLPLRRRVPRRAAGRVRAADPRRDARRRDAVHPRRRDRGAVGAGRRDHRRCGSATGRSSRTTRPERGGREPPTSCCTGTGRSWRRH